MRPSTVARHISVAFATMLVALVVAGGAGVVGLTLTSEVLDDLTYGTGPLLITNEQIRYHMLTADESQRAFVRSGDPAFLESYSLSRTNAQASLAGLRETVKPENRSLVESIERQQSAAAAWFGQYGDPITAARQRNPDEAAFMAASGQGQELIESFLSASAETGQDLVDSLIASNEALDDDRDLAIWVGSVAMVVGLAAATHARWKVRRDVTAPLTDLQATLRRIEGGDFSARLVPRGVDEVQGVARALNASTAETARLAEQQRDQLARLERIATAAQLIRSSLDLTEVLTAAADAIGVSVGADRVQVRALDDRGGDAGAGSWNAPGAASLSSDSPLELFSSPAFRQLQAGHTIEVRREGSDVSRQGNTWLAEEGITKAIIAPVLAADSLVAVVGMHWYDEEHRLSDLDASLVDAVCRELGSALGHARLYETERTLVGRLREVDQAKSDFVSTVSHELRTPMTSIVGYVEMLREGEVGDIDPQQDKILRVVQRNTERLLNLIDDLLTLSRIESGAFEVTLAPIDVRDVVEHALATLAPKVADRQQQLVTRVDDHLPELMGDAVQLDRVVLNLVGNAIKFTPEGGRITVALHESDRSGVELTVTDNGIGIPEPEQKQLFKRFFRSGAALANAIPGTGLGLVIVKSIVEGHGGSVDISSRPDEGTTVVVWLPQAASTDARAGAPERSVGAAPVASSSPIPTLGGPP
jgi:signal transduction histidine kinase/CHASE3 domain sensor protein